MFPSLAGIYVYVIHSSYWIINLHLYLPVVGGFFQPNLNSLFQMVDNEMHLLLKLWKALMWASIWGAINVWFLWLVILMNSSSAAEGPLGLRWSSQEPFSSVFDGFLKKLWQVLELFRTDWPSCQGSQSVAWQSLVTFYVAHGCGEAKDVWRYIASIHRWAQKKWTFSSSVILSLST